jgi:hypothetical protein
VFPSTKKRKWVYFASAPVLSSFHSACVAYTCCHDRFPKKSSTLAAEMDLAWQFLKHWTCVLPFVNYDSKNGNLLTCKTILRIERSLPGLGSAMRGKIVQMSNFMDDCVEKC